MAFHRNAVIKIHLFTVMQITEAGHCPQNSRPDQNCRSHGIYHQQGQNIRLHVFSGGFIPFSCLLCVFTALDRNRENLCKDQSQDCQGNGCLLYTSDKSREAAKKAKDVAEILQLKAQISTEKSKTKELYASIGVLYFKLSLIHI